MEDKVKTFIINVNTEETKKHSEFVENNQNIIAMAFLNDILKYLSALNVKKKGNLYATK